MPCRYTKSPSLSFTKAKTSLVERASQVYELFQPFQFDYTINELEYNNTLNSLCFNFWSIIKWTLELGVGGGGVASAPVAPPSLQAWLRQWKWWELRYSQVTLNCRLQEAGIECPVVGIGSTPSCSKPPDNLLKGITEFHPGNYVFYG